MHPPFPRLVAMLAASSLLGPTALGFASTPAAPTEPVPIEAANVAASSPDLDGSRAAIASRLVALGDEPARAEDASPPC